MKGQLAFEPQAGPEPEATIARLEIDFAGQVRPTADMLWLRINKNRILDIARETLGPAWASARAKNKKPALAWTPPGFAAFLCSHTPHARLYCRHGLPILESEQARHPVL